MSAPLNFYYNKALTHFNHRTLGLIFGTAAIIVGLKGMATPCPPVAKLGAALIVASVFAQIGLGFRSIKQSVPYEIGAAHAGMAMLIVSAFLLTMHGVRRPHPAHVEGLLRAYADKNGAEAAKALIERSGPKFQKRNKWLKEFKY